MKTISLFLFTIAILLGNVFGQTASEQDGCAPLSVQFTAPVGLNSYFWDFKDGATSTLQNPTNTYINTGTYNVELKEGANGRLIGSIQIQVNPKPDPLITVDQSKGCAPLLVRFSDATNLSPSVTVNNYSWVFEDGGTATGSSVSHLFSNAGNFWVSLELNTSSPSCNVTKQFNNFINVSAPPSAKFNTNPDPPSSCTAPLSVSFNNTSTAASSLSYQWNLGNGVTSTNTNPPAGNYSQDGLYNVTLVATDTNNCSDTARNVVSVGSPIADIQLPDTICLGEETIIKNASSSGIYGWGLDGGTFVRFINNRDLVVIYNTAGPKKISLNVRVGNCLAEDSISTYVEDPSADFTSAPQFSCQLPATLNYDALQGGLNYEWDFGGLDTAYTKSATYTYPFPEGENPYTINNYQYLKTTLKVTSNFGCKDELTRQDTIFRPTALMMPDKVNGCLPLTVTFSDSSRFLPVDTLVQWEWFFGDGSSLTRNNDAPVSHTYNQVGIYQSYLVITNQSGCTDTSFLTPIEVGEQYLLQLTVSPTSVCPGDTVTLTGAVLNGSSDSIKVWRFSNGVNTIPNPFDTNVVQYVYDINQLNQAISLSGVHNGCPSSVTTNPVTCLQPRAGIDYRNYCDSAFTVQFYDSSKNYDNVLWDFGDGTTSTLNNPNHTYASEGDYQVVLRAEKVGSRCPLDYDTVQVKIRQIKADFNYDTIACRGIPHRLDASVSANVFEDCFDGYTWSFSDSTMRPITTAKPIEQVSFNLRGNQFITLVVKDINGCRDTTTKQIEIFGVDASFSMSDTFICAPSTVDFTNLSTADTSITSYLWSFGDGKDTTVSDPKYTYLNFQDTNRVTLTVTDSLGCQDTSSQFIFMYIPFSNLSISDQSLCLGDTTYFSATDFTQQGSNLNFNWSFGNGDTSTAQNLSYLYNSSGNYTVRLNIEEQSSGCRNTISQIVRVVDHPTAGFLTSNDSTKFICPNENVLFTDTSISPFPLNYSWDFGNGRTSNFQNPGTVYINNGNYTVKMNVKMDAPFGCEDSISRVLNIKGPEGNFTTDLGTDTICRLDSVLFTIKDTADVEQYTWDFGDGNTLSNVSPVYHQYTFVPPSGQTIAKLILSNADGSCPVTLDTVINIYQVVANFQRNNGIDTAFCFAPLQLSNLSTRATNWTWDFGDGNSRQQGNQFAYQYDTAGIYDITLSAVNNNLNCNDSITKRVILYPNPEFEIISDTICEGQNSIVNISNSDPSWIYHWTSNPPLNQPLDSLPSINISPKQTLALRLNVLDTNNCSGVDQDTLEVINDLNLTNFDTIIVIGDRINLPINANAKLYNFTWTPATGLSCLDCLPPAIQPLERVLYNLQIADIKGCFSYNVDYTIDVHPETFIKMPTTFSPNGDGVNDVIHVRGWGIKELLKFQVFNRWGEVVFETSNLEQGWDGTYKGKIQNNDVYAYKVSVLTWKEEEQVLEGYINLVR